MKKLLITASTFPRWEGDTEPRFILDYAKAMTRYYEVHVIVPMAVGAKEEENLEGVNVHRFHYFPIHRFETLCYPGAIVPRIKERKLRIILVPFLFLSLRYALKKYSKKVDIVHAHWLIPQGIMQVGINETPYIVTGHGGDVTSLNIKPIKNLKKRCLNNAVAAVGVSSYICEKMHDICPDVNPIMISMGCDLTKFSPQRKNDNYFSHDRKNIIFVGRLAEKKGAKYLIEAMNNIDANLFIVGKGPLEEQLKSQASSVEGNKITFLGPKSHDELPEILASADLFVAPSIVAKDGDQEGLPVSIMEAMASGLPIVSGISGGTRDIVKDGINGFILDARDISRLSDRINKIITNEELVNKMSCEALKTSAEYSYEEIAASYHKIISNSL